MKNLIKKIIILLNIFLIFSNTLGYCAGFSAYTKKYSDMNTCDFNINFFSKFYDKYLDNYIYIALNNNHDIKSAVLKIEKYHQLEKLSISDELPHLHVAPFYNGIKIPHVSNFRNYESNGFILPFFLNYEIDLLLKNRNKTQSIKLLKKSCVYEHRLAILSIISNLVSTYINLIYLDELISLQNQITEMSYKIYKIEEKKEQKGVSNSIQKLYSQQNYINEKNNLDNLYKKYNTLRTAFFILLSPDGCDINDFKVKHLSIYEFDNGKYKIPQYLDSNIIFLRPDILSLEEQLKSLKIDVKVARKEFFPSFKLYGAYVFNTFGVGNFFSWEATLASILTGAIVDIFMGGKKIANLKLKKNQYEQLFENYFKSILNAQKEINDSLFDLKENKKIENQTYQLLLMENKKLNYEVKKYKKGVIANQDILQKNIEYLKLKKYYVETKTAKLISLISLFKACGGNIN